MPTTIYILLDPAEKQNVRRDIAPVGGQWGRWGIPRHHDQHGAGPGEAR